MKEDITNREDVYLLVSTFYKKVQKNPEIGPFFNTSIDNWPAHLEKLTDFWSTNLLVTNSYRGNPVEVHREVDNKFGNILEQRHFGEWLSMWFETLDELFEGERARIAKNRAKNMASHLFIYIYSSR